MLTSGVGENRSGWGEASGAAEAPGGEDRRHDEDPDGPGEGRRDRVRGGRAGGELAQRVGHARDGLRLGEGSGAALAWPVIDATARLMTSMASFESAGVSDRS